MGELEFRAVPDLAGDNPLAFLCSTCSDTVHYPDLLGHSIGHGQNRFIVDMSDVLNVKVTPA